MRTNAVLFLPTPGGAGAAMIGAIDADRIAEVYDFVLALDESDRGAKSV